MRTLKVVGRFVVEDGATAPLFVRDCASDEELSEIVRRVNEHDGLVKEVEELKGLLRKIEWDWYPDVDWEVCPACKSIKNYGHSADCPLAKAIDEDRAAGKERGNRCE